MKIKKITSLSLIAIQSISLLGIIQLATSCGEPQDTDEIIAHVYSQAEAYKKVAQYLYDNKTLSLQYLNDTLQPSNYYIDDMRFRADGTLRFYDLSINGSWSSTPPLCTYSIESDTSGSSDLLVFNLVRRVDENNALYVFYLNYPTTWQTTAFKTDHNIYVDFMGDGELV